MPRVISQTRAKLSQGSSAFCTNLVPHRVGQFRTIADKIFSEPTWCKTATSLALSISMTGEPGDYELIFEENTDGSQGSAR